MKIGAVIQARTGSTRLPGKVLRNLPYSSNITVLGQVIRRVKRSKKIGVTIVATSKKKQDEKIIKISKKEKVRCFQGSEKNVLSRYYKAAKKYALDVIVRITADCPCIDPEIIDTIVGIHLKKKADYTTNSLKRTYPWGLDLGVINFYALERAYQRAVKDYDKEHVVPYIYQRPNIFKIIKVEAPKELRAPDIRITLDTEKDYLLLCAIFDYLYFKKNYFTAQEIIDLFRKKKWLSLINK